MEGVRTFMFIVLIPAIIALGHDFYLFYANEGVDAVMADATQAIEDKGPFTLFASLGFIWTTYHQESFKIVAQSLDKQTWSYVNALLTQKAFFAGLAFAGFFYVILAIMKILGMGPFKEGSGKNFSNSNRTDRLMGNKGKKKMKFKRK